MKFKVIAQCGVKVCFSEHLYSTVVNINTQDVVILYYVAKYM